VRGTFPNLPPTHEVAQAVRSPLAFLDRLADEHERSLGDDAVDGEAPAGTVANGSVAGNGSVSPTVTEAPTVTKAQNTEAQSTGAHNGSGAPGPSPPGAHGVSADDVAPVGPGAFPAAPDDPSMN
jgi:hypothetical protein